MIGVCSLQGYILPITSLQHNIGRNYTTLGGRNYNMLGYYETLWGRRYEFYMML